MCENQSNQSPNVNRDTQMLIEYSRIFPHFSILSLRKIINQFDGDKQKIDEYLCKVNQRQSEMKVVKSQSKVYTMSNIPINNKTLEGNYGGDNYYSSNDRKRHVSAPQHQVPRILVLPPAKSHNSCTSLSPDALDGCSLTPDSLNEGRSSYKMKPKNLTDIPKIESESYELQFYRLWKSISSGDKDEPDNIDEIVESNKNYVIIQQEQQKALEDKVEELNKYRQFLTQFNDQLILLKQQRAKFDVLISE